MHPAESSFKQFSETRTAYCRKSAISSSRKVPLPPVAHLAAMKRLSSPAGKAGSLRRTISSSAAVKPSMRKGAFSSGGTKPTRAGK